MKLSERLRLGLGLTFALVGLLSPLVIDAFLLWWGGIYAVRRALGDEDVLDQKEHGRAEEHRGLADVTVQERDEGAHDVTNAGECIAGMRDDEGVRHIDKRFSPSDDFSIGYEELGQKIQEARIDCSDLEDDIEVEFRDFGLQPMLAMEPEDEDDIRRPPNPFMFVPPSDRPSPPLPPPQYVGEELREGQDPGWHWGNTDSANDVGFGNRRLSVKPGSSLLGGARSGQGHARDRPGENVFSLREPSTSKSLDDMSSADSQEHSDEDRGGKPRPTLANHRFTSERQLGQRVLEMSSRRYGEELIRLMTKHEHTTPNTPFAHDHASLNTSRTYYTPSLQDLSVLNTESQASKDKTINPWECESEPNPVIFRHLRVTPATQCLSSVEVQVETPIEIVSSRDPLTQSVDFQLSLDDSCWPPRENPQQFASVKASTTKEALPNQCEVDEEGSPPLYMPLPAEAVFALTSLPTSVSSVSIQTIVCKKCHATFSSQDDCSMHLKRKRCRRYACDVCPAKYHLRADLRRHKHTVHRDHYPSSNVFVCQNPKCSIPNKKFIRKDNFERHVRTCVSRIEATNQLV